MKLEESASTKGFRDWSILEFLVPDQVSENMLHRAYSAFDTLFSSLLYTLDGLMIVLKPNYESNHCTCRPLLRTVKAGSDGVYTT